MKRAGIAIAALFASACATVPNQTGRKTQVQIKWAGIYAANAVSPKPDSSGIINQQIEDVHLVRNTNRIPLRPGVRFGILYRVVDAPGTAVVTFRRILRFPAPGAIVQVGRPPVPYQQVEVPCAPASDCLTGYGLDQTWEMMPGMWTIELWHGDRKVAEQSFTVVVQ